MNAEEVEEQQKHGELNKEDRYPVGERQCVADLQANKGPFVSVVWPVFCFFVFLEKKCFCGFRVRGKIRT